MAVVLLVGLAAVIDRLALAPSPQAPTVASTARPDLQFNLDALVTGSGSARFSPGATAYTLGPHGAWLGASGVANVKTGEKIGPDARMRLESVSKIFTAALILKLDQDGRLHVTDTVERWLPGLLRSYGSKITIRDLLTMRSGLVSDSDIGPSRAVALRQLADVKDAKLRGQLTALAHQAAAQPDAPG